MPAAIANSVPQVERSVLERVIAPKGFNQITSLATSRGLGYGLDDDAIPNGAIFALIQAEGDLRWRDDGTDPTASVGMLIPDGQSIWYTGNLAEIEIIGDGSTANISFYGA